MTRTHTRYQHRRDRFSYLDHVKGPPLRRSVLVHDLTLELVRALSIERDPSFLNIESACREHIAPAFGSVDIRKLTRSEVQAYLDALLDAGAAPNTIHKLAWIFSRLFQFAIETGAAEENSALGLRLPSKRPRDPERGSREVLSIDQMFALIDDERIAFERRALWALMLLAGLRFGEAAAFGVDQIAEREPLPELVIDRAWNCRERLITKTKTGDIRRVPMHPALAPLIEHLGRRWHQTTALKWWHRDLEMLGIEHPSSGPRRMHGARHTFVARLLSAGADRHLVRSLTHSARLDFREGAFAYYAHFDWPSRCDAILRLGV